MKLVRPHIPIPVRLEVIARQLQENGKLREVLFAEASFASMPSQRLAYMLWAMFGHEKRHLDHDPPLCLRVIVDADRGIYDPPANDPKYLVYRTEEDHRLKTFVRGPGARLSDMGQRRKEIKRKKKEDPNRQRTRWPSRKIPSRKFPTRV